MYFWCFQFFQKRTKIFDLITMIPHSSGPIVFVHFLEEFKTPKILFEINWPLEETNIRKNCQFMSCLMIAWNFISLDTNFQQKPPASEIKVVIKMFKPRQIGQHRARHKIHDSFHLHLFVGTLFFICLCIILGFKCLGMWSMMRLQVHTFITFIKISDSLV